MAFDGMAVAALVAELQEKLLEGRIYKITQPESDELQVTIRKEKAQYLLFISAGAGLPLVYLTEEKKASPLTAPNFCMLLRKHLQNGRIVGISQPGLERVICLEVEHRNELGDLCRKRLQIEIMGKHSNLIFCDEDGRIIDSIKHVSAQMSSVREVLPGRMYFIPQTQEKVQPVGLSAQEVHQVLSQRSQPVKRALYQAFVGVSPVMAEETAYLAGVESDIPYPSLSEAEQQHLAGCFVRILERVRERAFAPCIIYDRGKPVEFAPWELAQYRDLEHRHFDSMSQVLSTFYQEKNTVSRIRQRSVDLRHIAQSALERNVKKYDLQRRQLADTDKMESCKLYGELLHTYGYAAEPGAASLVAENYYTGEMVTIPLDPQLSAAENANRYFERYGKLKRTKEALTKLTGETKEEIDYLESVLRGLDTARTEEDLLQIREELTLSDYIRRKGGAKPFKSKSRPYHFVSSDGFDMYVGRNNLQNEEVTFRLASGGDWWFHAKGLPGSHVVVKTGGQELPDRAFEEAASLAAHFSKAGEAQRVEIDYTQRKNVKKPSGGKPGFVVYYTNYSMVASTDISGLRQVEE